MIQTKTIDPVRWQDLQSRVTVLNNNGTSRVYYQVTAPLYISAMCKGRLVEEIPRILTIISPAHHLVSAKALDRLFDVTLPPLAVNMREALLQTQFLTGHFRKLYFLLTAFENPFTHSALPRRGSSHFNFSHMAKAVMRHLALAQEAAIILGGRHEHPLTSLPGGVSCYLKNNSYERLGEIAEILVRFVGELAGFFRKNFWTSSDIMTIFSEINLTPMAGVLLDIRNSDDSENRRGDEIVVTDISGKETSRFSIEKALDNIDLAGETWTYLPFTFFRDKGWQGVKSGADSLFFTGPLARMNGNKAMDTEKAEEERGNMVEILGPFPHFSVCAAFWALIVEAFQSAEKMTRLCVREKLTGPFTRQIPKTIGSESHAALESPQGIIYHHYQVDSKGIVEKVRILDTSMENNALRCLMAQKVYEVSMADNESWEKTKNRIEVSLLPF